MKLIMCISRCVFRDMHYFGDMFSYIKINYYIIVQISD